jgi:hypothetical protein
VQEAGGRIRRNVAESGRAGLVEKRVFRDSVAGAGEVHFVSGLGDVNSWESTFAENPALQVRAVLSGSAHS